MDAKQIQEELFDIQKELNYINAIASSIEITYKAGSNTHVSNTTSTIPERFINCPNCGAPVTTGKCEYCGSMFG